MSSSSYSQGLQSCLEPSNLAEPRVLSIKLAPQKPKTFPRSPSSSPSPLPPPSPKPQTFNAEEDEYQQQVGGWSFLQSLTSSNSRSNIPIYNPPSIKPSPSFLCEKSLEMCTESLGSETGSEVSEGAEKIEEMASLALLSLDNVEDNSHGAANYNHVNRQWSGSELGLGGRRRKYNKYRRSVTFPPPLTSISGSSGVQVRPHREGGRLVLQAVSFCSSHGYFHAERNNGRLTLRLTMDCDYEEEETEEEEKEEMVEEKDEEAQEEEEEEAEYWEDESEENIGTGGEEIGMVGKVATRPITRCKERESGNKGLLNWGEPFWVAT